MPDSNNVEHIENFISAYNHLFGLFELTPEPILVANKSGKICYCNSIFIKLFGYDASEIIGSPVEFLLPKRYRDKHPSLMAEYWRHPVKRPMGTGVQPVGVTQKGDEVHLDISLSPIGNELVLCILRDVTEEIISQNQTQQYSQLNTIGLLSASLVHEISNPTQTISGTIELLKRHLSNISDDPYLAAKIEDIAYARNQLVELLGSFRMLMKEESLENGQETGSIRSAIDTSKRLCAHNLIGIEFIVDISPDAKDVVPISSSKLAQVLINLYSNAAYSTLKAGIKSPQIKTEVFNDENNDVTIIVCDNGTGVPEILEEKIFDPMFSTKPANQGTGLGLNICRDMLKKVGGKIHLVSNNQIGACFEMNLPASKAMDDGS